MNKIIYITVILLLAGLTKLQAQTYLISNYNNQTLTTCSGTLFDSGGQNGNFMANESFEITICPATAGASIKLTFATWDVGTATLEVFDGASTAANSYGTFDATMSPVGMIVGASTNNPGGCITLKWTSTADAPGFSAGISCGFPCQPFAPVLDPTITTFDLDSGIYYVDICPSDTLFLGATGDFAANDSFYHQNDQTTTFIWDFGNGTGDTNITTQVFYDTISGFNISLIAYDSTGCMSTTSYEIRARIATKPNIYATHPEEGIICQEDSTDLIGSFIGKRWVSNSKLNVANITYLPDGSGASYNSSVVFNTFAPGQTLTNPNHLLKVFATLEHSFLGDLDIIVRCPNGSESILKSYPGGGSTYLGEPIDGNAQQIEGIGYEYWWSNTGTTTMLGAVGTYNYSYTDALGNVVNNHSYLPPSGAYPANATSTPQSALVTYTPETSYSNLVGCPLNGTWTMEIIDNLTIDNGFIFSWGIEFDPNILPVSWDYTPFMEDSVWTAINGGTIVNGNTAVGVQPGTWDYTFTATDNFGCSYDTTVQVYVVEKPVVDIGNDTSLCYGDFVILDAGDTLPNSSYLWSVGATSRTVTVYVEDMWSVTVSHTDSNVTCSTTDSVMINVFDMPVVDLLFSPDTCVLNGFQLDAGNDGANPPFLYQWSTGSTSQIIDVSQTGTYSVTVSQDPNMVCFRADTVEVTMLPADFLGPDLELCMFEDKVIAAAGTVAHLNPIWEVNGVGAGSGSSISLDGYNVGDYIVTFDANGCYGEINVSLLGCEIEEFYNIITPNGDGRNDIFVFDGLDDFPESTLRIYNRWGKKVYEASPYQNNWDGENLADGVYFWTLQFGKGEFQLEESGSITIMRE